MGHLLYSEGKTSFSACVPAKSGSTSFFLFMYGLLSGSKYPISKLDRIHKFREWNFPNVTETSVPGKLHFIVKRDPIERYISAFHSKVRCCQTTENLSHVLAHERQILKRLTSQKIIERTQRRISSLETRLTNHTRIPCFGDWDDLVPNLRQLANLSPQNCLTFNEFADTLERVHRDNKQAELDPHFLPQHIACPLPKNTPTMIVDASQVHMFFTKLRGFTLHKTNYIRVHKSTDRPSYTTYGQYGMTRLRALSGPEYANKVLRGPDIGFES